MTKLLLRKIAWMCYWFLLVAVNWFNAVLTASHWWCLISIIFAVLSLFMAGGEYFKARKIATAIDMLPRSTIILTEKTCTDGHSQKSPVTTAESDTDHPNNVGCPV